MNHCACFGFCLFLIVGGDVCVHVCVYTCMWGVHVCVCMCVCTWVHACMRACVCALAWGVHICGGCVACTCACVYVCVFNRDPGNWTQALRFARKLPYPLNRLPRHSDERNICSSVASAPSLQLWLSLPFNSPVPKSHI